MTCFQKAYAGKFDCTDLSLEPTVRSTFSKTPTSDFAFRDRLPRTEVPSSKWQTCCGTYGPCANVYPQVRFPKRADHREWSRQRVVAAAKKWIGVPYAHHHIPEMGGLDCSNFTALVYNYALGIRFSSHVERQSREAGRRLESNERLLPGDLIFLRGVNQERISHVLILVDEKTIIDSTGPGVALRPFDGKYKTRFAWARRIVE